MFGVKTMSYDTTRMEVTPEPSPTGSFGGDPAPPASEKATGSRTLENLDRMRRKVGFRKFVMVESEPRAAEHRVLFVPDSLPSRQSEHYPYTPTEPVVTDPRNLTPEERESYVTQTSEFEIRTYGMSAKQLDPRIPLMPRGNELVLYSLETDDEPNSPEFKEEGIPRVHYHHRADSAVKPDTYQAIPASKSLVLYSTGAPRVNHVNARFKILELDDVDQSMRDAIDGIGNLSSQLNGVSIAMPFLSVLSPAFGMAGEIGRRALDSYARPDRVISIDMNFRLIPETPGGVARCRPGDYLRYGYYFFLSEPVPAKLYASITTSRNCRLMMRVVGPKKALQKGKLQSQAKQAGAMQAAISGDGEQPSPDALSYIPLTRVSYLVIRVNDPNGDEDSLQKLRSQKPRLTLSMVRRLQLIVETAKEQDAEKVKADIAAIMDELHGNGEQSATADVYVAPSDS